MVRLGTPSTHRAVRPAVLALLVAACALIAVAACGGTAGPAGGQGTSSPTGGAILGGAPGATTPVATPPHTTPPLASPLNCGQLQNAAVTTATVKLPDYPFDSINLAAGRWSAEDGTEILLKSPCAIGDLVGDASADAVGVVTISTGGTGLFYQLVAWRNSSGSPALAATASLGDRNPVTSLSIASKKLTVVYLTRTSDASMAELNLRRTALYKVSGKALVEISHTDEPYTP
jgi:hypothetical protein